MKWMLISAPVHCKGWCRAVMRSCDHCFTAIFLGTVSSLVHVQTRGDSLYSNHLLTAKTKWFVSLNVVNRVCNDDLCAGASQKKRGIWES